MLDNHHIYLIIKEKLALGGGQTIKDRLGNAFDLITDDRERTHRGDVDYAAAEHYLFARWLIAWTGAAGYPFLAMGAGGYAIIKRILPDAALQHLRFGSGPVTPYEPGDVAWAKRGADDGMIDFNGVLIGRKVPHDPPDPM